MFGIREFAIEAQHFCLKSSNPKTHKNNACQCEEEPYLRGQGLDCVGSTFKEDLTGTTRGKLAFQSGCTTWPTPAKLIGKESSPSKPY